MSLYEQLPDDLLAGFFVEINKNIDKGIPSEAMYHEIDLIRAAAKKRGMSEGDLQRIYLEQINSHYKQIARQDQLTHNENASTVSLSLSNQKRRSCS